MAVNYKLANGVDLDSVFEFRVGSKIANTGLVDVNGTDLSNRYERLSSGSFISSNTGFQNTSGNDLRSLFCAKGSIPEPEPEPEVLPDLMQSRTLGWSSNPPWVNNKIIINIVDTGVQGLMDVIANGSNIGKFTFNAEAWARQDDIRLHVEMLHGPGEHIQPTDYAPSYGVNGLDWRNTTITVTKNPDRPPNYRRTPNYLVLTYGLNANGSLPAVAFRNVVNINFFEEG